MEFEVTNLERFGFWLLNNDKEYFVSFEEYPWFKKASIEQILNIKKIGPEQFHWPDLDEDIEIGALEDPGKFNLSYK